MLHKNDSLALTRALSCALALLAGAASGFAQEAPKEPVEMALPYSQGSKASPDDVAKAKALGATLVRDILDAYETMKTPEMEQDAQRLKQKHDDIADATLAKERDKVLDFLGIDPQANSGLYYLVSWSMPLELLRSYVIEAMWAGGTVAFKGVPPGKELGKFIVNDLRQLVYGKGAAVNISIDPRLFDAYGVTTVPTIVFATVRDNLECESAEIVPVPVPGEPAAGYRPCPELDPALYWRMTGAVTTSYALETFIDNGAVQAKPYLKALSKGMLNGTQSPKEQRGFNGKWEDAISPSEMMAIREAAGLMTKPVAPQ